MTLFAASCAICFAAVVLTDADDPVSSRSRSRSNLAGRRGQDEHSDCHMRTDTHLDVIT